MNQMSKVAVVSLLLGGAAGAEPSPQLTDRAKATVGTWKCEGTGAGMDGKEIKFAGTYITKTDLDGVWLHSSFVGAFGEGKGATKYKFETYATWDAGLKRWRQLYMDNFGGQEVGGGAEMTAGKLEITSELQDALGKNTMKDDLDATDPKKLHMNGEQSKDGGKTWAKTYDMSCKK